MGAISLIENNLGLVLLGFNNRYPITPAIITPYNVLFFTNSNHFSLGCVYVDMLYGVLMLNLLVLLCGVFELWFFVFLVALLLWPYGQVFYHWPVVSLTVYV